MNKILLLGSIAILVWPWSRAAGSGGAATAGLPAAASVHFDELDIHLEVDLPPPAAPATLGVAAGMALGDLPAELVVRAHSPNPLTRLRVLDSAQRQIFDVDMSRNNDAGLTEIELESEGQSLSDLLHDYPEGQYTIEALTTLGAAVRGSVRLNARLPGPFAVVSPGPEATVPFDVVDFSWTPSPGAARYVLEVEQELLGMRFQIEIPGRQTSFQLPVQLLQRGVPYEYSLVVQGDTDNELEIEGRFFTEP